MMPVPAPTNPMPLASWFWRSYFRAAVVPLLVIELSFLLVYWVSTQITYDRNVATVEAVSTEELGRTARSQAATIAQTLQGVSGLTRVFAAETARALAAPVPPVSAAERERYALSPDGVLYTRPDAAGAPRQAAAFFSGVIPVGPAQMDTVWRSTLLDPLMKAMTDANPLITQVYVNTHESYNRIYPGFDVLATYEPAMDIPSFNFYYEADASHNPGAKAVWTAAYVDPAGSGWMVSSIAPVYRGDTLEAVVGVDVTIKTIIDTILNLTLPWDGYAVLVGRDGAILALPRRGEQDFGLTELTDHTYADAIQSDTFKPDDFNILKRADTKAIAEAIGSGDGHVFTLDLTRRLVAAVAPVAGPGWSLVVLAPESAILAHANDLYAGLVKVGTAMIVILLLFYLVFFAVLYGRARTMSQRVAAPLRTLEAAIERIGARDYDQPVPVTEVEELNRLGAGVRAMAAQLSDADRAQQEAANRARDSLDRERWLNEQQRQFINVVSHEFRTPLAIIDSSARVLERRPEALGPADLAARAGRMRTAVRRLCDVVDSGIAFARVERTGDAPWSAVDLDALCRAAVAGSLEAFPDRQVIVEAAALPPLHGDPGAIRVAIAALVDNALRYSPTDTVVRVNLGLAGDSAVVTVSDDGPGIAAEDLPRIKQQFFRGGNSHGTHGAGVGLYIADVCAKLHQGRLDVSCGVGKVRGTRCSLGLPLAAKDVPPPTVPGCEPELA